MILTVAAMACTAGAVALRWPPPRWVAGHRLGRPSSSVRWPLVGAAVLGAMVIGFAVDVLDRPPVLLLVAAGTGVAWFVVRQVRATRRRDRRDRAREETTEVIDLLAAELRAGGSPHRAVPSLSADLPVLLPVARAMALGGDVAGAFRELATGAGREGFAALGAAWQVAERSGAPVSSVLERVAASAREDAENAREVRAGAAPARASGRLMALLPLVGLGLGAGIGADPVAVVTGSIVGATSVTSGVGLACLGVVWVDRIADRAEVT
ncbi:type II secretion system F family protein [Aeromicrobium marinum]|uniref:type II secretion system F family protein n=1 Tax=Aeromicrobium marinum TaxID=219314 RepID=UPI00068174DD|nr:type II secretion system F family protein [Aeromicrobium marinum]